MLTLPLKPMYPVGREFLSMVLNPLNRRWRSERDLLRAEEDLLERLVMDRAPLRERLACVHCYRIVDVATLTELQVEYAATLGDHPQHPQRRYELQLAEQAATGPESRCYRVLEIDARGRSILETPSRSPMQLLLPFDDAQ